MKTTNNSNINILEISNLLYPNHLKTTQYCPNYHLQVVLNERFSWLGKFSIGSTEWTQTNRKQKTIGTEAKLNKKIQLATDQP